MSAIQFLREKAGVFVAGLIGLSLFLFVVSDFFGGGRGQRLQAKKAYQMVKLPGNIFLTRTMNRESRTCLKFTNYRELQP